MSNQYGIDMAKVLKVKDEVSLNKLKREKREEQAKVDKAGYENRLASARKENPGMSEEELDNYALNPEERDYKRGRKDKADDRQSTHRNALSRIGYSSKLARGNMDYKASLTAAAGEAEKQRQIKIIKAENPDMSDDMIEAYAGKKATNFNTMLKHIESAKNIRELDAFTGVISQDGARLHQLSTIKDPTQQQLAWTKYRNEKIKSVTDPKQLQQVMSEIPEDYDAQFVGKTLASSSALMKSASEMKKYMNRSAGDKDLTLTKGQRATGERAARKTIEDTIENDTDLYEKYQGRGKDKLKDIAATQKYMKENNVGVDEAMAKVLYPKDKAASKNGGMKSSKKEGTKGSKDGKDYITKDGQWIEV